MTESATRRADALLTEWEPPRTPRQWEQDFPGVLDPYGVLAGAANVIMQLALPPVGYGVMESPVDTGNLFKHPIKRARTTFTYLTVAMLGNTEEKLAYRKAVNGSHAQVRSTADSPVKYNAFDPQLQLWVAACLYVGVVDVLTRLHGPLPRARHEALYRALQPLGTTLQVRPGMWPQTLEDFDAYWQSTLLQTQIDPVMRGFLLSIVDFRFVHPIVRLVFGRLHRALTAGFLPDRLREQMGLAWDAKEQRLFERVLGVLRVSQRMTPRVLRQLPSNLVMWDFRRRLRRGKSLV